MPESDSQPKPQAKLSHKDVSGMSNAEFLDAAKVPYRRLLSYVRPYKTRFAMGVFFGVIAGFFNMIILFGLKFVFAVILGPDPGMTEEFKPFHNIPGMENVVIQPPELPDGYQWLWIAGVCSIVPILILCRGLLGYLHQYCMIWVGTKVLYQLRHEVFSNLLRQSMKFYSSAKTGELMQTVFNQTRMAQNAGTDLASDLVKHPISIISIVCFLMMLDWKYTLCACVLFPLCILPVMAVAKKVRKAGGKEEEEAGMLMVTMQETFSGIRVVKSQAREDFELDRFNAADRKMLAFIMRWRKAMEIVGPLVETVASIGIAGGLIYAKFVGMTAADFLILNMALMSMYPHAKALSRIQITLQKCLIATTKVFALIDMKPDVEDAPDAVPLKDVKGEIAFKSVAFKYPKADAYALDGIALRMKPGKKYALVGRSGSGKSTLFALLMRFYDPQHGQITIDGIDLRNVTQRSLRDNIGIVNQEVFLFHDTIYNNILYGNPHATKKQVHEAARRAHAHEFIMEKEGGYQAKVGDKGFTLSGGQQQRISIARAILRDAPILLLDEAFSALDTESEQAVHAALEELSAGKTVIAIAHRLSTILNADRILVMDRGKFVAKGSHEELMEKSEHYRNLYNLQFHSHLESQPEAPLTSP